MPVVETKVERGVMTITLADEARRNALSTELTGELVAAFRAADDDPAVRVVVLTNRGSVFCAGADLSARSSESSGSSSSVPAAVTDPRQLFGHIRRSPKPFVGRIAGHCVAGGMGLAAACDISVVVDDAKLGFTEVRVGVAPAVISVVCLPKMRSADARSAFLRGNRFTAAQAVEMGLVNTAVPRDELDATVDAVVADLLAGSPAALAASKQLLERVPSMPVDDAFSWTSELSAALFAGDDAQQGMRAYLEKRPAPWIPTPD